MDDCLTLITIRCSAVGWSTAKSGWDPSVSTPVLPDVVLDAARCLKVTMHALVSGQSQRKGCKVSKLLSCIGDKDHFKVRPFSAKYLYPDPQVLLLPHRSVRRSTQVCIHLSVSAGIVRLSVPLWRYLSWWPANDFSISAWSSR